MPHERTDLILEHDGMLHRNLLFVPQGWSTAATVLVLPDWHGRTASQEMIGRRLADNGHPALCVDVYGDGRSAADFVTAEALMTPLVQDRARLAHRLGWLVDEFRSMSPAYGERLAAAGFCFGGLCALDLARTGRDFALVASFHGVLDPHPALSGGRMSSPVMLFHGWKDPIVPPDSLLGLIEELRAAGAPWELHAFGDAMHAFMMPDAHNPEAGIVFDEAIAGRCWDVLLARLRSSSRPMS